MSFNYSGNIKISVFGQSHSEAIGVVIDNLPCGYDIDEQKLQAFCDRRRSLDNLSTPRKEADKVKIVSGLFNGKTCGSPVMAIIENTDVRSKDYEKLASHPRPSHADFTSKIKYGGYGDYRGGGHFSGRMTAPLCIAGGIIKQILEENGITAGAHLYSIKDVYDIPFDLVNVSEKDFVTGFPCRDEEKAEKMKEIILSAKAQGNSVGGIIECAVLGVEAGYGSPMFDGVENVISSLMFAVPAVKGIEFGNGFSASTLYGSENNDNIINENGKTETNNSGGINGGITNGNPIVFRVALKPTPSIHKVQQTYNFAENKVDGLIVGGRHDPCVAVRAVPVIESMAMIATLDIILKEKTLDKKKA